ncbi:O-antigen/teichoic acid export membrane protein [Novosphingobium hassiacum]|uniref:O-antigen/teichoic acid export membrane protein n=1 Tax=Novosphingobium hassiacum TaxID=173676 RepID=A0A7W5ZYW3_9SPHN|nr:O-antigen/teichoic acid export membrane protein [Novosphingobium hassiacum]
MSTVIAARTLGPAAYGTLALILTIGRVSERVLRFESWQPLIRFAAQRDVERDPARMSQLMLYGLLLDISTALLAAVLTIAAGYTLATVIHLGASALPLVAIYAVAIAVNVRGMPTAALRINAQFRTLAYVQLFASVLRVVAALVALSLDLDLLAFVTIWTAAQIIDSMLFNYLGFRTLHRLSIPSPLRASWRNLPSEFPGFLGFAFSTNLSSTLRTFTQEADTLLVSAFAGSNAAGFYHIAKRIAKVAQQVGAMIQAVVYPDMARMWANAQHRAFRRITARLQLALAAAGLAILFTTWVLGGFLVNVAFGSEFADAYPLLLAQLVAVILIMHAAPSRSALLAMNRPRFVLGTAVISTALFFMVALYALPRFGAIGANFAHIAFSAFTAIAMDLCWWRGSNVPTTLEAPAAAAAS